jgi:hypothetical protein
VTSQPLTYHVGLISGDYVNQWREGLRVVCSRGEQVSVMAAGQDTPRHPGARSPEGPSRRPLVLMEPSGLCRDMHRLAIMQSVDSLGKGAPCHGPVPALAVFSSGIVHTGVGGW